MGYGGMSSQNYSFGVDALKSTGKQFARSQQAASTGNYSNIAEALDPRKLKNGMREACYAPGLTDLLPIAVGIDGTGSMEAVPGEIQERLPKLIELIVEQGISDHPNVMFQIFDDEKGLPDAAFQISQFEIGAKELLHSLNEMIIPGQGCGNHGESYHLFFYALARHTRLESFDKTGEKGVAVLICDEEPIWGNDPAKTGTTPTIAKDLFGDVLDREVPMLESVRQCAERYHILIIRPQHTSHGTNKSITKLWQSLLGEAGCNPENVLEVEKTESIVATIALAVGQMHGHDQSDLVDVLKSKGVSTDDAARATTAIVPFAGAQLATAGVASGTLPSGTTGRKRS